MLFVVVKEVSIQYAVVIGIVRCWAALWSLDHLFVYLSCDNYFLVYLLSIFDRYFTSEWK